MRQKKRHSNSNKRFFRQLGLIFLLTTGCLFCSYKTINAASIATTKYIINGQLSIYLSKQSSIGQYVNIMLIEETIAEKTTKVTLYESGFKLISKQPMPFKLSYSEIPKHSKNTIDSTSRYNIHIVIAGNKSGSPVITTMTTPIIANQHYNDLNLAFQALPEPAK